jgi:hypothetical protein
MMICTGLPSGRAGPGSELLLGVISFFRVLGGFVDGVLRLLLMGRVIGEIMPERFEEAFVLVRILGRPREIEEKIWVGGK